jgi:hypothetical protein
MRRTIAVALLVALVCVCAVSAHAQPGSSAANPFEESSAGRAMKRITFGAIDCMPGQPTCPNDAFTTSELFGNGTYGDTRLNYGGPLNQADVSNSLLSLILTQSQTFPGASTASGFTFTVGGVVPVRESELYGPLFGERALTNGKRQLSVTLNTHRLRFSSLDGSEIRNGQAGLLWGDTNYDSAGGAYVGICRMDINTTVFFAAANYGLLDQLDVSLAVPVVRTTVEGSNEFLDYVLTGTTIGESSFLPQGRYFVRGESTGLGDMAIGAKYAFVRRSEAGAAVTVRTSLPTGSLEDMTGTGEFQTSIGFVGSAEKSGWSPHLNVSYLFAGGEVLDELNYNVGVSYSLLPRRMTVGAEMVGRRLYDVTEFTSTVQLGVLQSPITGDFFPVRDFRAETDDVDLFFFAVGGKIRMGGRLLASLYAIVPAGGSGLQVQRPTFNVGVNYAF